MCTQTAIPSVPRANGALAPATALVLRYPR
jgi:hypothetical protein